MPSAESTPTALRDSLYSADWNERTYAECLRRAEHLLFAGNRVIVDATFREEQKRHIFLEHGGPLGRARRHVALPVRRGKSAPAARVTAGRRLRRRLVNPLACRSALGGAWPRDEEGGYRHLDRRQRRAKLIGGAGNFTAAWRPFITFVLTTPPRRIDYGPILLPTWPPRDLPSDRSSDCSCG